MVTFEQKLEALLFYVGKPLSKKDISEYLDIEEAQVESIATVLANNLSGRGIELLMVEDEYELVTSPETSSLIAKARKQVSLKDIGKAGGETLAIILYRGPVSRAELEEIRGVNCTQIIRDLSIRGLITQKERENKTSPVLYIPTPLLFEHLGIVRKEDLPGYTAVCDEIEHFEKGNDFPLEEKSGSSDSFKEEEILEEKEDVKEDFPRKHKEEISFPEKQKERGVEEEEKETSFKEETREDAGEEERRSLSLEKLLDSEGEQKEKEEKKEEEKEKKEEDAPFTPLAQKEEKSILGHTIEKELEKSTFVREEEKNEESENQGKIIPLSSSQDENIKDPSHILARDRLRALETKKPLPEEEYEKNEELKNTSD
jgi:segregation and condensation protein B